jgi:hypothetical protein
MIIYHPDFKNEGKQNKAVIDRETGLVFEPMLIEGLGKYPARNVVNPETIKGLLARGFAKFEPVKVAPKPIEVKPSKKE